MKSRSVATFLLLFVLLATGYATSPKSETSIPVTLQDESQGVIANGRLMLRGANGKNAVAARGRYLTREQKVVLVQDHGRVDAKTIAELKAALPSATKTAKTADSNSSSGAAAATPPAHATPTPSTSWGQRHQTGTHY